MIPMHVLIEDQFRDWLDTENSVPSLEQMAQSGPPDLAEKARELIESGRGNQALIAFNSAHSPVIDTDDLWKLLAMAFPEPDPETSMSDLPATIVARARYRLGLPLSPQMFGLARGIEDNAAELRKG